MHIEVLTLSSQNHSTENSLWSLKRSNQNILQINHKARLTMEATRNRTVALSINLFKAKLYDGKKAPKPI